MRVAIEVRGRVQGVGFRPAVFREARRRQLTGWVQNAKDGAHIEAQGNASDITAFVEAIRSLPPPTAVERLDRRELPERFERDFSIRASRSSTPAGAAIAPDLAPCVECIREIRNSSARRYGYVFTSCSHCGPRYSILTAMPYDRQHTTLSEFPLCSACQREYTDPSDRRFHAESIACPACGPRLTLLDPRGNEIGREELALNEAARAIRGGRIVAVLGIGGFQLLADATCSETVSTLRRRKHRPDKPFAILFADLSMARQYCVVTNAEAEVLSSPAAPIVLVTRRDHPAPSTVRPIAEHLAPDNPCWGAMLPSSPLHTLLFDRLDTPLLCTSGNLSSEPLCLSTNEALHRLSHIADCLLTHDRRVVRALDDSVVQLARGKPQLLRRARGHAPEPIAILPSTAPMLAVGAHQKNTVAVNVRGQLIQSQHQGDLDTVAARAHFERTTEDLLHHFEVQPVCVAHDLHPEFFSTRFAQELSTRCSIPTLAVQHHHAHIAACCLEHDVRGPVLGLAWDGMGYGDDGELWGGEALLVEGSEFRRLSHLAYFPLIGGDVAALEPRRSALGLLHQAALPPDALPPGCFERRELDPLVRCLERRVHAPLTSSMGRLFDGVACLLGLTPRCSFEGQASQTLMYLAQRETNQGSYPIEWSTRAIDWRPLLASLLQDRKRGAAVPEMARRFHESLVDLAVVLAERASQRHVVLAGGCFQNRLLLERIDEELTRRGFSVHAPERMPPGDASLSAGQLYVASLHHADQGSPARGNMSCV